MEDAPVCVAADDAVALEDERAGCFGDSICEGMLAIVSMGRSGGGNVNVGRAYSLTSRTEPGRTY
jgi:hypothetical protein